MEQQSDKKDPLAADESQVLSAMFVGFASWTVNQLFVSFPSLMHRALLALLFRLGGSKLVMHQVHNL